MRALRWQYRWAGWREWWTTRLRGPARGGQAQGWFKKTALLAPGNPAPAAQIQAAERSAYGGGHDQADAQAHGCYHHAEREILLLDNLVPLSTGVILSMMTKQIQNTTTPTSANRMEPKNAAGRNHSKSNIVTLLLLCAARAALRCFPIPAACTRC